MRNPINPFRVQPIARVMLLVRSHPGDTALAVAVLIFLEWVGWGVGALLDLPGVLGFPALLWLCLVELWKWVTHNWINAAAAIAFVFFAGWAGRASARDAARERERIAEELVSSRLHVIDLDGEKRRLAARGERKAK